MRYENKPAKLYTGSRPNWTHPDYPSQNKPSNPKGNTFYFTEAVSLSEYFIVWIVWQLMEVIYSLAPLNPCHVFTDRNCTCTSLERAVHCQLNWAILLCGVIPDWKNWVNCAVLTGNSAGLRTVLSSRLSHTELRSSLKESHSFLSLYLPTPRWHHLKAHPFLANHSADKHRMIYSFPNATAYSTIYAFFSSFRITLWPMWLANSKRQPCFYPPQSHAQQDTQNWQNNWQTWWETYAVPENIQFSFSCSFFTQLNCTV